VVGRAEEEPEKYKPESQVLRKNWRREGAKERASPIRNEGE